MEKEAVIDRKVSTASSCESGVTKKDEDCKDDFAILVFLSFLSTVPL